MKNSIRWRGLTAEYTPDERLIMAALPVKEQAVVHTLKAFCEGDLRSAFTEGEIAQPPAQQARVTEREPGGSTPSHGPLGGEKAQPVYTDPEDIEFGTSYDGKPKRRPKVYAV